MSIATTKTDLLENCHDREYREALNYENVYATICAQLRTLREQRGLSQAQFGRNVKMAQERISILEDPNANTKPTLVTLLRLAAGYDVGLDVRFVPFSTVLDRSINTDQKDLEVESFEDEFCAEPSTPKEEKELDAKPQLGALQQLASGHFDPALKQAYDAVWYALGNAGMNHTLNSFQAAEDWGQVEGADGAFPNGGMLPPEKNPDPPLGYTGPEKVTPIDTKRKRDSWILKTTQPPSLPQLKALNY